MTAMNRSSRSLGILPLLAALLGAPAWGADAPAPADPIEQSGPGFSIKAAVPVLPGGGAAVAAANREVRARVEAMVAAFRAAHQEAAAAGPPPGADWSLLIEHGPPEHSAGLLAVMLTGYDFRGGAHGMPITEPLVFAAADGRPIPPAGLFRPDSDWLGRLAARCYAELKLRGLAATDETWLRAGTEPKAENYRVLYPAPTGLKVLFPPYQVAAYVEGIQEVLIPYADLAGVLAPSLFPGQPAAGP